MLDEIISEVNTLRSTLAPRSQFQTPEFLKELSRRLKGTRLLYRQPIIQCFIEDLEHVGSGSIRLTQTKAHINEKRNNQIFSLFDADYFPTLTLDFLQYRPLPVNRDLAARFESNTFPVTMGAMSDGFKDRVVVALFPENHLDHVQERNDLIFYFIDKFIERHNRLTRRLIANVMDAAAFPRLRVATQADIEKASTHWVWLHEYHHRQGDLPLPEYLPMKTFKPLAGLEELRVDVSGMLVCINSDVLPRDDGALTYEFVLAERLLRYAVEGIPHPNYDAVASQLLFNYLREHGGICLRCGLIHLLPRLPEVLGKFLGEIERIERQIRTSDLTTVRGLLLQFVNQYTDYDQQIGDYRHIDFFFDVKQRLGI